MPCKHEYSDFRILIALGATLPFGAATPPTDVWTSETREKQVRKQTKIFFFLSKTFYHEGASLSELPVTQASK